MSYALHTVKPIGAYLRSVIIVTYSVFTSYKLFVCLMFGTFRAFYLFIKTLQAWWILNQNFSSRKDNTLSWKLPPTAEENCSWVLCVCQYELCLSPNHLILSQYKNKLEGSIKETWLRFLSKSKVILRIPKHDEKNVFITSFFFFF